MLLISKRYGIAQIKDLGYVGEKVFSRSCRGEWGHVPRQIRSVQGSTSSISSPSTIHRGLWLSASPSDLPTGTHWNQYRVMQYMIPVGYPALYVITKKHCKTNFRVFHYTVLICDIPVLVVHFCYGYYITQ